MYCLATSHRCPGLWDPSVVVLVRLQVMSPARGALQHTAWCAGGLHGDNTSVNPTFQFFNPRCVSAASMLRSDLARQLNCWSARAGWLWAEIRLLSAPAVVIFVHHDTVGHSHGHTATVAYHADDAHHLYALSAFAAHLSA